MLERIAKGPGKNTLSRVLKRPGAGNHPDIGITDTAQAIAEQLHSRGARKAAVKHQQHKRLFFHEVAIVLTAGQQPQQVAGPAKRCR